MALRDQHLSCEPDISAAYAATFATLDLLTRFQSTARSSALSAPKAKALLKIALDTQSKTSSFVLLAAGFSFLFGLFSLLLLQIDLKKVQRKPTAARKILVLKRLMFGFVWTSTALAFGAAFATTQLAKVIQHTSSNSVSIVSSSLVVEGGTGVQ
ncbi:MAG: hypothetical protein LQ346_008515, partial [Caloplaca aetnensis]